MRHAIFSFCNQKGGVGKTTSTINMATLLGMKGYKVLVIDMDSQANSTSGLGEEKPALEFTAYQLFVDNSDPSQLIKKTVQKNVDLIASCADLSGAELDLVDQDRREFILKGELEKLKNQYDFIFIDCPPSLGLITINCLTASDYIIIPLQCEYYALEGLGQLLNTFQLVKQNLNQELEVGGVLMTMADLRTNLTQQVIEEVRNYFKDKVFGTIIPRAVKISEAPSFGQPAVVYDTHNRGTIAYQQVTKEFLNRFGQFDQNAPQEKVMQETTSQPQGTNQEGEV
ncbi:MAG: ParA family protein [Candidatus Omnitrophica bacterium]|nr:ParA family protein [Candidatus Omnitrophota bacterium]